MTEPGTANMTDTTTLQPVHGPGAGERLQRATRIESPAGQVVHRFLRHRLAVIGLVAFLIIVFLAVAAPLVARHNPDQINLLTRNQGPSWAHWFGTDRTGRDTWARTVYAGRISLAVGVGAVAISVSIGALLGSLSGYFGGLVESLIMRFTDVVMTFPAIVIILTLVALVGPGLWTALVVIGALNWPIPCRLVRAKFLAVREQEFILAARAIGVPTGRIILRHAFPSVIDVLIVYASLGMANAVLLEAGLSFLGLGVQPPTASWGNMLNVAQNIDVLEHYPWQWLPAGIAIAITVLAVNFIGDGLRDALDPRLRL